MATPDVNTAVERIDLEPGYMVFRATKNVPMEARPRFIESAIMQWQKQNPGLKIRTTFPIVSEGNTVAVHVWFD